MQHEEIKTGLGVTCSGLQPVFEKTGIKHVKANITYN